jgi:hypothetical protein
VFGDPASLLADRQSAWPRYDYLDLIVAGGYPEVLSIPVQSARRSWFDGYLSTVIVRDIGESASVRDADIPQLP